MLKKLSPTIAVIDSGIGGISILKKLIEKYQVGNYLYFADNMYMPYGNKDIGFIKQRITNLINWLKEHYDADLVILACNTASSAFLKKRIDGVIKFEYDKTLTYLTTPLTAKNLAGFKTISCDFLAKEIEENINDKNRLKEIVHKCVKKYKLNKLPILVLGCTHYELVKEYFDQFCPKTKVISNSDFLFKKLNFNPNNDELSLVFLTSRQDRAYEKTLRSLLSN